MLSPNLPAPQNATTLAATGHYFIVQSCLLGRDSPGFAPPGSLSEQHVACRRPESMKFWCVKELAGADVLISNPVGPYKAIAGCYEAGVKARLPSGRNGLSGARRFQE